MNVLLLSMPDSFEHMPSVVIRMPNGALGSLAGNVDPHHRVTIADLILVQRSVAPTIERLVRETAPDIVGLSVMTFQRHTARKIVKLLRRLKPNIRIVLGGYDASLAVDAYHDGEADGGGPLVDFVIRGEGESTFRNLLRVLEDGGDLESVPSLTFRRENKFVHNGPGPVERLEKNEIHLPNRSARVLKGYTMVGRPVDVIETSRGCTFDCSFCSIVEMRGRNFHVFPIERVIEDIRDAQRHGARAIFIVDDNIMLNVARFEQICEAIIRAGLHRLDYYVQAMTSSIANNGEKLARLMRKAGFRYVFLGIENVNQENLKDLSAAAKNTERKAGVAGGNATLRAIGYLHQNGMYVVGGLIVGSPDDTAASIEANLSMARQFIDWPYIQHPTPYPRTPMARDLAQRGLIAHDRVEEYDGTTSVLRTKHLASEEVEFMRWKAERWMKVRHFPVVLAHNPRFVLKHGSRMIAHVFRGCTWKTFLGLEEERKAFQRYRTIRQTERTYL